MSNTRESETLLARWLAEGPTEINDRVVEAALDEVERTKQRRVLRAPRLWDLLTARPIGLAGAAAVVVVIVVGGLLLLRFAPLGNVGGNATPTPPVSVPPSSTPTIAPSPSANPFPGATSLFGVTSTVAGVTYFSDLTPAFALEPGVGWGVDHDQATLVGIHNGPSLSNGAPKYSVQFLVPFKVVQPGTAGPTAVPTDLIAWLEARPDLSLSAPQPVTIGGLTGTLVEGGLRSGAALNPEGIVNLICANVSTCGYEGGQLIALGPDRHATFVVLDVRGTTVVIALVGPAANTAADRAKLDTVLNSVTFAAP
jgi:hypothetical protein